MRNPTSKQFKKVIANLDKVLPFATKRGHLEMEESELPSNPDNICGTPMCHGGWYAVANDIFSKDGWNDYSEGADLMAEHLGFAHSNELENWAQENPDLWGNIYGHQIFYHADAFNNAKTLRGIRNWWAKVHNRTCTRAKPVELV